MLKLGVKRADQPCVDFVTRLRLVGSCERGFTLIELLVTMSILLVVLTTVTDALISGTHAQTAAGNRVQVQTDARLALGRMRDDLHCAVAAPAVAANTDSLGNITGFSLAITENPGQCQGVDSTSNPYVKWCTVQTLTNGSFELFRTEEPTATPTCDTSRANFELTDIVKPAGGWPTSTLASCSVNCYGNLWPDARQCPTGHNFLATQAVEIAVNPDPPGSPSETYELDDTIALRNSSPCGYTAPSVLQFAWWPTNKVVNQTVSASEIPVDISGGSSPTGTITIKAFTGATAPADCTTGGTTVGTATVNGNGMYQYSGSAFPSGGLSTTTYWWYASYDGDIDNSPEATLCNSSSMPHTTVTSTPQPSTTTLAVSPSSGVTMATSVTLTATVTASGGGAGPTGTVNFYSATGASAPGASCGGAGWTATSPAGGTLSGTQASINVTPSSAATWWWCAKYAGDGSFQSSTSSAVSRVVTNAPDTFGVSSIGNKTAGSAFTVATITANLPGGGTDTSYTGAHCLTFSDPSNSPNNTPPSYPAKGTCATGESAVTFTAGVASNVPITLYDAQTTTLTAKDTHGANGTISGQSNSFTVGAGSTSSFTLTNPGSQTAGVSFNVAVTTSDSWGNQTNDNSSYTVSWSGAGNAPNGTAPTYASTTLVFAAGNALATGFKFYNAASTTLKMTQGAGNYTSTFTVNGGAGTGITMVNPGSQTAGTPFAVTFKNFDAWGNLSNDNSSHTFTWSGASNAPDGTAPVYGSSTVTLSGGQATVSGFTFDKAASTTLKATEGSNNYTATFTVNAGAAAILHWSGTPTVSAGTLSPAGASCITTCSWTSAGRSHTFTASVTVWDAHQNPISGQAVSFAATSKWGSGSLTTNASGVTGTNTFTTTGSNGWSTDTATATVGSITITINITK